MCLDFYTDDFTVMFLEVRHFDFLRVELAAVESKLSALSRREQQQQLLKQTGAYSTGEMADAIFTTTHSLLLPADCSEELLVAGKDGAGGAGGRRKLEDQADEDGTRGNSSISSKADEQLTADRLSFWN